MFTGQNILPGFPEELTKVVNFLNEKAAIGEFEFCESYSYWEDNENIIDSLGLSYTGDTYYFAVSLAYLSAKCNGKLVFPEKLNHWRWAFSLSTIATYADWKPSFMKRVICSFMGIKKEIDSLMGGVTQVYARTNYDFGLSLLDDFPQFRKNIKAGLMENNFDRYCQAFHPSDNQDEFTESFCMVVFTHQDMVDKAFDIVKGFSPFSSTAAMAFLLRIRSLLSLEKKADCDKRIMNLLKSGCTSGYVHISSNWIYSEGNDLDFVKEYVISLIEGLGKDNSSLLSAIDSQIANKHDDPVFISKVLFTIAEKLSPLDVLKMESCLRHLYEHKETFHNFVMALIIHPDGVYRLLGRRLWDDYHLENFDLNLTDIEEVFQCAFIVSMLQDFGNPETRLPKILPLLENGTEKVQNFIMGQLRPYLDEYMGHVINAIDELRIDNKHTKIIKDYFERRSALVKERKNTKELSPSYMHEKELKEAIRVQNEHQQLEIKEAEANYHSAIKDLMPTVILARGGAWRSTDGKANYLPTTSFSMPARMLKESMSPKEQAEWERNLLENWDDTTGNN